MFIKSSYSHCNLVRYFFSNQTSACKFQMPAELVKPKFCDALLFAGASQIPYISLPLMELQAALEGLCIAVLVSQATNVLLEGDSLTIVCWIREGFDFSLAPNWCLSDSTHVRSIPHRFSCATCILPCQSVC